MSSVFEINHQLVVAKTTLVSLNYVVLVVVEIGFPKLSRYESKCMVTNNRMA